MLSRFLIQSTKLRTTNLSKSFTCSFHSGSSLYKEEKKVEETTASVEGNASTAGFIERVGLNDWKISAPIALACSIPALSNGFYVLNEESQLACCFFLFCTSVYKFGGDAIASYFDQRAQAILQEHNEIEDANIALAKQALEAHKTILSIHDEMKLVQKAHDETVELMCRVQHYKLKHRTRDMFIKNLEAIADIEATYQQRLQFSMVKKATDNVRKVVEKGDKSLKANAFEHALNILSQKNVDSSKKDDVINLFSKELRSFAESLEKQNGKVIKLTAEEQKMIQAELDAFMKRLDMEDAQLKALPEIKMEI